MDQTPENVLIVDDSLSARLWAKATVEDILPDCSVVLATNADDALAKAAETTDISHMLIDVNMPGRDGVSLAIEMRGRYPGALIALVTANVQKATRDQAEEHELAFIPKPITEDKARAFFAPAADEERKRA